MSNGMQTPQTPPPPPPPPAPAAQPPAMPPKKGLPALAWVGIGCGALVVLVLVVLFAGGLFVAHKVKQAGIDTDLMKKNPGLAIVKMTVAANPELEMVSVDEDAGTATVRNTKTGEVITVNLKDVKDGKVSLTSGDKTMTLEAKGEGKTGTVKITGSSDEGETTFVAGAGGEQNVPGWVPVYPGTEPTGGFHVAAKGKVNGSFAVTTSDGPEAVMKFYSDKLEGDGFKVTSNTFTQNGELQGGTVSGKDDAGNRFIQVGVSNDEEKTAVTVTYQEGE